LHSSVSDDNSDGHKYCDDNDVPSRNDSASLLSYPTLSAVAALPATTTATTTMIKLTKLENAGIFVLSMILVNFIQKIWKVLRESKKNNETASTEEEELLTAINGDNGGGGMLDRCPWPFIFFHDIKTGLKDAPTWILVLWWSLRRVWRLRKSVAAAAMV